jgi:predicted DNA-binding protein (MmcQ/YjbR family)
MIAYSEALKDHCRGLDGAWEDHPWGDDIFKVGKKMFAGVGVDESGIAGVTIKPPAEDLDGLLQLPFVSLAPMWAGSTCWLPTTHSSRWRAISSIRATLG